MTEQHKAAPEQWESIEMYAEDNVYDACILELRARVEALEAAQRPSPSPAAERVLGMLKRIQEGTLTLAEALQEIGAPTPSPAGSLVERVRGIIGLDPVGDSKARAAIREVAAWLQVESEGHFGSGPHWAQRLRQEATR